VLALGKPTVALGGGGYNLKTVARQWTLLYGALSGQTFPQAVPEAYAEEWGITALHDTSGPSAAETAVVFDQIYRRRRADTAVMDARAYARRGVEMIRERVFPMHGIG